MELERIKNRAITNPWYQESSGLAEGWNDKDSRIDTPATCPHRFSITRAELERSRSSVGTRH